MTPKAQDMQFDRGTRACINSLRFVSLNALIFLCSLLHAQENRCGVEVKLLLSPTEDQAAVTALNVRKEMTGFIYFFDTNTLDLLSQGVIVRLRQGIDNDLTVKFRPSKGEKFSDLATEEETFKCGLFDQSKIRRQPAPSDVVRHISPVKSWAKEIIRRDEDLH
jgi:hypothetical protein